MQLPAKNSVHFAHSFSGFMRPIVTIGTAVVLIGVGANKALADPPPNPPLPDIFCFRITDIDAVTDPEGDKFQIEFEVLNWTHLPATDVDIALDIATDVSFDAAFIDANGRPLGPGDSPPPGNLNTVNDWSVTTQTDTYVRWDAGTPIPKIDLLGGELAPFITPGNPETIDDGPNVLDGFVLQVDDWDPGEILSFNWFLTNNGTPIGTAGGGNPYGFGVVNIARIDGAEDLLGSPVFQGNTGFRDGPIEFANNSNILPGGERFAMEMAGGITAGFQNPDDSTNICGPNGCPVNAVPEPASTLIGSGLLVGIGGVLKRRSHKDKKTSGQA
ncbi:hypothetical protein PMH09_05205 [Roseofilum sp. BLCC_M143]|uniref:PEP-CTERM sorting domain-containing protein n=2 Tax=Roseofilum TaxID=1233426 RepID=A0ABT7BVV5_9CYAN|nr:hypothetical protein [Roseofilum casamattae BLCC-M143]